ncbi:MAG: hypothetical protein H7Z40_10435 [Phycisphaerae bacterium]|nr:hypothetical protein [Gemmatimonadaceae bacterium]
MTTSIALDCASATRNDGAATLYREALGMRLKTATPTLGVAITRSNLSVVLYRKGDLDGAVAMGDSALTLV